MKIDDCVKCEFNIESLSDSILCTFASEVEHHVLSQGNVVGCPKNEERKGLKKFFH
jgi:hypothetical protein